MDTYPNMKASKKTIIQGIVEGVRKRGCQKKQWLDNITEWKKMDINDFVYVVHDRDGWR